MGAKLDRRSRQEMGGDVLDPEDFDKESGEDGLGQIAANAVGSLRRRRWWFALPAAVIALAVAGGSLLLTNTYRSVATVGVVEQQVSQRVVASEDRSMDELVGAMTRQILSRPSLLKVVDELHLYSWMKESTSPDDIAAMMQADLSIEPILSSTNRSIEALRVSYTASDAKLAQSVTTRLVSLFMDENQKRREGKLEMNSSFISSELQSAKEKLDKQDAWLQSFKSRNLGQLPEQQGSNLQVLADLRGRVQSVAGDVERARRELRSVQTTVSDRLAALQAARSELLVKFAPRHQEVVKKDAEIARYQALQELANSGGAQAASRQVLATVDDSNVNQLRNQLTASWESIENLTKEEARLRSEIESYQSRVNVAPLREQELSQAMRDYNLLKEDYANLKSKEMQQNLSENLAQRQDGSQFRLLDPPSLPSRPVGPNRLKYCLGGLGGGLLIGLILALVVDKINESFS